MGVGQIAAICSASFYSEGVYQYNVIQRINQMDRIWPDADSKFFAAELQKDRAYRYRIHFCANWYLSQIP